MIYKKSIKPVSSQLPLVISRELVVFPGAVVPFFTSEPHGIQAIQRAAASDRLVFFAFPQEEDSSKDDDHPADRINIYRVGTVVKVLQVFKLQNGSVRILGEAKYRGTIQRVFEDSECSFADIEPRPSHAAAAGFSNVQVLMNGVKKYFREYASVENKLPKETRESVEQESSPDRLVDLIAAAVQISPKKKVQLLQEFNIRKRLQDTAVLLETEQELLKLHSQIQDKVREKIEHTQKEYFLNEQIRQINKELGRDADEADEAEQLFKQIESKQPPQEIRDKARKEADRLRKLQPMAPESGVLRTYLEWLADLPWGQVTADSFDLRTAEQILDEDHYNMKRPKERILDYMAVRRLHPRLKGPILCFVGPPGTGKTSLGRSVARSLGKNFIRISLGGVRDEAEIRGHRKTYVGALPGKIIQSIKKAGTSNPVFLLDEVDKLSSDFRGDPASALLEVLDPEQNSTFTDHYLEVPYDLSQVLFIATANSLHTVPRALQDRMEIIEIPGYSDIEKFHIAKQFLIPKQLKENGLDKADITFQKQTVYTLIRDYTMESGVRNLERSISTVSRKIAREFLNLRKPKSLEDFRKQVTPNMLRTYLGNPDYAEDQVQKTDVPGVAHGLAWTESGGKLLTVEAVLLPGKGNLILTGNLGEVMKESARISYSYLQAHHSSIQVNAEAFGSYDIHIHVPQGAIPKDGPSAGITILCALASAFSGVSVREKVSMTGEITLTGNVLSIGGVKEKLLAAYRHGLTTVVLPEGNRRSLDDDIPASVLSTLNIIHVSKVDEALRYLLLDAAENKET